MEGRTGHEVHQVSGIMFDGNHDSTISFAAILLFVDLAGKSRARTFQFFPLNMPDGEKPVIPPAPAIHIERTLALFKPDAVHKSDEIEEIILQHGFTILQVLMNQPCFLFSC